MQKSGSWIYSLLAGVMVTVSYLLKPSSIVFLIAWVIIRSVLLIINQRFSKQAGILLIISVIGFSGTLFSFRVFQSNQNLVEINTEYAKPWEHFVNMGLKGDGGYNSQDSQAINALPTQEAKKEYARDEIVKRLNGHGVIGYIQFLMVKQTNNTARGDFGWGTDGGDQTPNYPVDSRIDEILVDFYYTQGHNTGTIRFYMQLFWIITLIGLALSYKKVDSDHNLQILKLSILGACLFLLLFEGGRSRYLFQFLPMIYILAGVGIRGLFKQVKLNIFNKNKCNYNHK